MRNIAKRLKHRFYIRLLLIWSCEAKYGCSGYGIGLDARSQFLWTDDS